MSVDARTDRPDLTAGGAAPVGPVRPAGPAETVIEAAGGWQPFDLKELWRCRELLFIFLWRDLTARYRQTVLGAAWAVLKPALLAGAFTLALGSFGPAASGGVPYPVFVFGGLICWTFFSGALLASCESLAASENLITKVYFPRIVIPVAAVAGHLVDFAISLLVLLGLMLAYGVRPGWTVVYAPAVMLLFALAALGFGSLLAALGVKYRDVRAVTPFLVQVWMFATPTIFLQTPPAQVPDAPAAVAAADPQGEGNPRGQILARARAGLPGWQALNPLTGLIDFFRAALMGDPLPWRSLAVSGAFVALVLAVGLSYFRRVEHTFADII